MEEDLAQENYDNEEERNQKVSKLLYHIDSRDNISLCHC
jgi:hypothetical protein